MARVWAFVQFAEYVLGFAWIVLVTLAVLAADRRMASGRK